MFADGKKRVKHMELAELSETETMCQFFLQPPNESFSKKLEIISDEVWSLCSPPVKIAEFWQKVRIQGHADLGINPDASRYMILSKKTGLFFT